MIAYMAEKELIISVDTPSGYDVDLTDGTDSTLPPFRPRAIISLSVPKPVAYYCAGHYGTAHYLAANIVPYELQERYGITGL